MPRQTTYNTSSNRVDLSNMVQVNTNALNKALTDLNTKVSTLEQENVELKARMEEMEKKING